MEQYGTVWNIGGCWPWKNKKDLTTIFLLDFRHVHGQWIAGGKNKMHGFGLTIWGSKMLRQSQVVKMSLTLIGGRVSAEGKIRSQFASILESMTSFEEKSEMCTLLSPGAVAGGVAAGLVATKPLPSLTSTNSSEAVACAEELVNNIKRADSGAQVAAMGGKLKTGSLPTA